MMLPTIHSNGTGRTVLEEQIEKAYVALSAAIRALEECEPNGRDYYPQGEHAYAKARDEHLSRLARVQDVASELQTVWEGIVNP
jgi:hypothetical protein